MGNIALVHDQALILDGDQMLAFLIAFSALILKPSFSQSLSLYTHLFLAQAHLLEYDHSVFGSHCRQ